MPRTPISISDVAHRAGVSRATVSRVLSGRTGEQIAVETRRRVEAAVTELGYVPNALARNLARNRTNTIGLAFLHSHQPLHTTESFVLMMDGILEKATLCRKDTLFCTSYSWADGRHHISALLDRRCDGLVLVVPRKNVEAVPLLLEYEIPFVLLAGHSEDPSVSTVDTDNEGAACQLVHYLMDQGHRRIAFLTWEDVHHGFSYGAERARGYQRAYRERGLPPDQEQLVVLKDTPAELLALMRLPPERRPTALFGVCDSMALEAMTYLTENGWRVPSDVSVVGYDDIASAARATPALTTIRQPLKRMGERCVEVLLGQIDGSLEPGTKEVMPVELVVRQSVGPPPRT